MRGVADRRPEGRRRFRAPVFIGVGAAAALAAIAAMVQTRDTLAPRRPPQPTAVIAPPNPVPSSASPEARAPQENSSAFVSTGTSGAREPLDQFAPVASALAQDPLQSEVDSVYADARYAVQFLASNFLPTGALVAERSQRAPGSDLRRGGG